MSSLKSVPLRAIHFGLPLFDSQLLRPFTRPPGVTVQSVLWYESLLPPLCPVGSCNARFVQAAAFGIHIKDPSFWGLSGIRPVVNPQLEALEAVTTACSKILNDQCLSERFGAVNSCPVVTPKVPPSQVSLSMFVNSHTLVFNRTSTTSMLGSHSLSSAGGVCR